MKLARKTIYAAVSLLLGAICILMFLLPFYQSVTTAITVKTVSTFSGFASVLGSESITNDIYIDGIIQPYLGYLSTCSGSTIHLVGFSFIATSACVTFVSLFSKHKLTPILNLINIILLVSSAIMLLLGKDSFVEANGIIGDTLMTPWLIILVITMFITVAVQIVSLLEFTLMKKGK